MPTAPSALRAGSVLRSVVLLNAVASTLLAKLGRMRFGILEQPDVRQYYVVAMSKTVLIETRRIG